MIPRSTLKHWSPSLGVSCVWQTGDVTFRAEATSARGLAQLMDVTLAFPGELSVVRLYLRPNTIPSPGESSTLRFNFDPDSKVAAAVLVAVDNNDHVYEWMTRGDAESDVELVHDTWNANETRFPSDAYITLDQLREIVVEWAFRPDGELPPSGSEWAPAPDVGWL